MDASRKLVRTLILVILWAFRGHSQSPSVKSLEVTRGNPVVLPASYTSITDITKNVVLWTFNTSKQVITYTSAGDGMANVQFSNRVEFLYPMPSTNLSILINNTQEGDSGQYVWQVIVPKSPGHTGELKLTVNVPPSVPVCTMTGSPVLRGNVTLKCNSVEGKPAPLYKWNKSSPDSSQFFPPTLNQQLGTLRLNNLTSSMSGKYTCQSINVAGSGVCYIELQVSSATNAGVIAGATIGALLGLVAIILFIIFILRRKKESEDDMANDIKEDAQAPKRVSWAKSGTGSDIISKNGTLSSIATSPHLHDRPHIQNYPVSDTASIVTTVGSISGYNPHPGAGSPVPRAGPGSVMNISLPRGANGPATTNGNFTQRTEQARPPRPSPIPVVPPIPTGVTASNISRMGGVPVMVPAQNQAGSLV